MPLITRLHVRLAFLWLLIGMSLWVALPAVGLANVQYFRLTSNQIPLHCITVGFLMQVTFGVAWWLLPRPVGATTVPQAGTLDFALLAALNVGLAMRLVSEPLRPWELAVLPAWLRVSGVLLWLAAIGFVVRVWPRVRGK